MKIYLGIGILLITIMSSCVSSLHPLYSADTLTTRSEMEGSWMESDGNGQWTFVKEEALGYNYYELTYIEKELNSNKTRRSKYNVHLIKLGNYYFLDFGLLLDEEDQEKLLSNVLSPVVITHKFAKIDIINGKLKIHLFDDDWITDLFEKQKIRMKHEKLENGGILLTASTEELQKFVKKYANEQQAFSDELILTRKAI